MAPGCYSCIGIIAIRTVAHITYRCSTSLYCTGRISVAIIVIIRVECYSTSFINDTITIIINAVTNFYCSRIYCIIVIIAICVVGYISCRLGASNLTNIWITKTVSVIIGIPNQGIYTIAVFIYTIACYISSSRIYSCIGVITV